MPELPECSAAKLFRAISEADDCRVGNLVKTESFTAQTLEAGIGQVLGQIEEDATDGIAQALAPEYNGMLQQLLAAAAGKGLPQETLEKAFRATDSLNVAYLASFGPASKLAGSTGIMTAGCP